MVSVSATSIQRSSSLTRSVHASSMPRINLKQSPTSRSFRFASLQQSNLHGRVRNLSNVLRDIDDVLPQRDLPTQRTIEFGQIIQGCHNVLRELEETLDKYQELDPDTKGFAGRSRRVWKRLRWDQTTIDGFRSRVTSNVLLFNTFLGQINTSAARFPLSWLR